MKKFLFLILAFVMLFSSVCLNVYAEKGPYPNNFEDITEEDLNNPDNIKMSFVAFAEYDSNGKISNVSYVYPKEIAEELPVSKKGVSYNSKTNTLTLNGYKSNELLLIAGMGDDFEIKLSSYNEIGAITTADIGWGCSVTVTGTGGLSVNKYKMFSPAISMDFNETHKGFFKVEKTAALKIYKTANASSDFPTITIDSVTEPKASKTMILGGSVNVSKYSVSKKSEYTYATADYKYLSYEPNPNIYKKDNDDTIYASDYNNETSTHKMYTLKYDELFKGEATQYYEPYIATPIKGQEKVKSPEDLGYKKLENSNIHYYFYVTDKTYTYNLAKESDGTVFAFKMLYWGPDEWELTTLPIIDHPIYGKVVGSIMSDGNFVSSGYYSKGIDAKLNTYYTYKNNGNITVNYSYFKKPAETKISKVENSVSGVKISWAKATGSQKYYVYRKKGTAKSWTRIGTTTATSFIDSNVSNKVKYTYTVKAVNFTGNGAYNKTGKSIVHIATPDLSTSNSSAGIKVSWKKISGATGYVVYSSQYSPTSKKWSAWKNRGTAKATASSWTDKNVKSGTKYKYAVRALNGKAKSSIKSSSITRLSQPTVKFANTSTGIKVSWKKITGSKGYIVYRSEYKNGKWSSWKNLGTISASKTSYIDSEPTVGKNYRYTVRAYNGNVKSSFVTPKKCITFKK